MIMNFRKYSVLILILSLFNIYAQENQLIKANEDFERFAYVDARKIYQKVAKNGYSSPDLYQKLGDSYYFNGELEEAVKWYESLVNEYEDEIEAEYLFRYAQSLKSAKRYVEADKVMEKFYMQTGNDQRANSFMTTRDYLKFIDMQSGKFQLLKLSVNSEHSDYAPSFNHHGDLIFASSRNSRNMTKTVHEWNEMPFLDLFYSKMNIDGDLSPPKKIRGGINTRFHESSSTFSKDGKTMYFTRNNFTKRKVKMDSTGTILLKIYKAKLKGSQWTDIEELPFNGEEYSVAHPALSADGTKLYFASDMPGSRGQSDIYEIDIYEDGSFGVPRNLGDQINTEGRETFPYISDSGVLYFSSDGHTGLGGLDVFVAVQEDGYFSLPYNVGRPINSPEDDFSFVVNETTRMGYFSSNRNGGKGNDDIYSFKQTEELITKCKQFIKGTVTDKETRERMGDAAVILLDENNDEITRTLTNEDGEYSLDVECNKSYILQAKQIAYAPTETVFTTNSSLGEENEYPLELERGGLEEKEVEEGNDLAAVLELEVIYFDLDKANIRPDAEVELQKIIEALREYPRLRINVRSHTDSRGKDKYNMMLSEKRAQSTVNYIIEQGGISSERVSGKGYGETELLNKCSNGVKCSKEEHQKNRRSEFIIIR